MTILTCIHAALCTGWSERFFAPSWRRIMWPTLLALTRLIASVATLTDHSDDQITTRHLLAIGQDARGLPVSVFTLDNRATGDLMLGATGTRRMLEGMRLHAAHDAIETVLECVIALCAGDIRMILAARDTALSGKHKCAVLTDTRLEILSSRAIALDAKLRAAP